MALHFVTIIKYLKQSNFIREEKKYNYLYIFRVSMKINKNVGFKETLTKKKSQKSHYT